MWSRALNKTFSLIVHECFFFSDGIYLLFWWWLLLSKVKIVCLFTYILFILSHLGGVNDSKTLSTKETRDKHRPYEPSWLGEGFKIDFFIHLYMFFIYDNLFNNTLTFICLFFFGGGGGRKISDKFCKAT